MRVEINDAGVVVEMDSSMLDELTDIKCVLTLWMDSGNHKEFLSKLQCHLTEIDVPCRTCKATRSMMKGAQKERDILFDKNKELVKLNAERHKSK